MAAPTERQKAATVDVVKRMVIIGDCCVRRQERSNSVSYRVVSSEQHHRQRAKRMEEMDSC